ncbi:hypothetical protein L1049_023742 [Liquidambar formosana]|uniref:Protein DGCR14 n=1 Tax=Liquidambar formosana TaxID=63359 RepID=A0AAP0RZJ3_LIQFO
MLFSPGHSPRHLSSPSPSLSSTPLLQNPNSSSSSSSSSKNQSENPRKQINVLDEDSYVAAIEKIIERDFFPDIPKLRDRLDWLEAVRSGDPVQIRDAQLKIMERRARKAANCDTEGKTRESRTPGSTFVRNFTPFELDKTPSVMNNDVTGGGGELSNDEAVETSLSLDEFFRRYTSEDNDSFSKILEKVNRKRKERYGFLTEGEKEDVKLIEDLKMDRITDGYGTSDQPLSTLEGWKYTAKNLLMYHPSDQGEVPLTEEERAVRIKGLTKEINRTNTRFHGALLDSRPKEEDTVAKPPLPSPVRGGSASPSVRTLSPAAQKFVRNAIAKSSCSVDETLRASYRGASPGVGTPKSVRSMSRFGRDGSVASRSPSVREATFYSKGRQPGSVQ